MVRQLLRQAGCWVWGPWEVCRPLFQLTTIRPEMVTEMTDTTETPTPDTPGLDRDTVEDLGVEYQGAKQGTAAIPRLVRMQMGWGQTRARLPPGSLPLPSPE